MKNKLGLPEKSPTGWYQAIEDGIEDIGLAGFLHSVAEKINEKADRISPSVELDEDSPLWAQVEEADKLRDAADEIEAIAGNL